MSRSCSGPGSVYFCTEEVVPPRAGRGASLAHSPDDIKQLGGGEDLEAGTASLRQARTASCCHRNLSSASSFLSWVRGRTFSYLTHHPTVPRSALSKTLTLNTAFNKAPTTYQLGSSHRGRSQEPMQTEPRAAHPAGLPVQSPGPAQEPWGWNGVCFSLSRDVLRGPSVPEPRSVLEILPPPECYPVGTR